MKLDTFLSKQKKNTECFFFKTGLPKTVTQNSEIYPQVLPF